MIRYFILICSFIRATHALLDVTIDQHVTESGFHRVLVTNITLYGNLTSCNLAIEEKFPKNLLINKDELDNLVKNQEIVTRLNVEIDPEASATTAVPFSSYIYLNKSHPVTTSTEFSSVYVYKIPIHVRYHDPKSGGGFREFRKLPSVLFARCPSENNAFSLSVSKFPCEPHSTEVCDWNSLPFTQKNLLPTLVIPVGNTDYYQTVLFSTHITAYVALLYILYTLFYKISS